ncbi:MAG TPA: hypothetical protein PKE69_12260 [Pyrinomonadaceae bacterium]|nr:hypothetical protein [Pyrinomonadaceae bacterium]
MKYLFGTFAILIFLIISVNAQATRKTSLLVSNCKAGQVGCEVYELFRYDFVNGEYVGKEKIVTVNFSEVIFDGWKDIVYQNRYLITRWGDIIDVIEKKVIHDDDGEVHRIENNKVYTKIQNQRYKNGLYVFDLETKKYKQVRKIDDGMSSGELSPNGIRSAQGWCITSNVCGIKISDVGNNTKLIKGNFNTLREFNLRSSDMMIVPVFWLDDENFLSQHTNGEIVIVSIKGKITPLVKIEIKELPRHNPYFYRNAEGEIIYDCANKYILSVEQKSYKQLEKGFVGNGFTVIDDEWIKGNFGITKNFFYNGTEIGRVYSDHPVTTKNFLAVNYGEYGSNLGYPDGVKVWNNIKKNWTTIEIKPLPEISGWIEE